jgi:CTP-dependent riboflavin kinase
LVIRKKGYHGSLDLFFQGSLVLQLGLGEFFLGFHKFRQHPVEFLGIAPYLIEIGLIS